MRAEVTIRPYADRDLDAVIAVLHDLQSSERLLFDRMRAPEDLPSDYVQTVRKEAEEAGGCLLVAESDGEILGYCTLLTRCNSGEELDEAHYEYAYVGDLGVRAGYRSQGIGARLLEACEECCRTAGVRWLRLSVLAANVRARSFYDGHGFGENLILLEKAL